MPLVSQTRTWYLGKSHSLNHIDFQGFMKEIVFFNAEMILPSSTFSESNFFRHGCKGANEICTSSKVPCNSYTTRNECENGCFLDATCTSYEWEEKTLSCQLSTSCSKVEKRSQSWQLFQKQHLCPFDNVSICKSTSCLKQLMLHHQ